MKIYLIGIYSTSLDNRFEGYFINTYRVADEIYPAYSTEINEKTKIYKTRKRAELGVKSLENKFVNYNFKVQEIEKSDK